MVRHIRNALLLTMEARLPAAAAAESLCAARGGGVLPRKARLSHNRGHAALCAARAAFTGCGEQVRLFRPVSSRAAMLFIM